MLVNNVRCNFFHGFKPYSFLEGGIPKYSIQVIIPQDDPQVGELLKVAEAAGKKKHGSSYKLGTFNDQGFPIMDGNLKEKGGEEYADCYYFNCSTNLANPPKIVNRRNKPIAEEDNLIYSGCMVNVDIFPYAYTSGRTKGVSFKLRGVQYVGPGEPLYTGNGPAFHDLDAGKDGEGNIDALVDGTE